MMWKVLAFTLLFTFNLFFKFGGCANILIATPFHVKSHYLNVRPIGLELARRGHNVTIITAFKETDHLPNYKEIFIDAPAILASMGLKRPNITDLHQLSDIGQQDTYGRFVPINKAVLATETIQTFLKEDHHFDVVIAEQFYNEAFNMLAHKYNCPLILVSSFGNCMKQNVIMGNPLQLISLYSEYISVKDYTSVWSKLKNVYNTVREYYKWVTQYLLQQEEYAKNYLNLVAEINNSNDYKNKYNIKNTAKEIPSLYDVQRSVSLFLINRHFSFDTPAAYLPNIVEIGGVHLIKDESDHDFPQDLQKILDQSKYGVIYVSFGTNAQVSDLPWTKRQNLIELFRNLNQTILWKCDVDIENLPANVVIRKWFSQKHILAHPNVRLFIAHGGLIGVQETVFHGVPILGIPLYGDQTRNILQAQLHGTGRMLPFEDLDNIDTLRQTVTDIINDDIMKNNAVDLANKFKDRPREALDTAVLRIEKVIENNGFVDFGVPLKDVSWIEYYLLDVFAIICLVILFILFVIVLTIKWLNMFFIKDAIRRKKLL